MSTYGHFAVEVKTRNNGWQRIIWKSKKSLYPYLSEEEEKTEGDDYVHEYVLVGNYYRFRDSLKSEEFGHDNVLDDFTPETKSNIEEFKGNYGWYEGYFYLNELNSFIKEKKSEIEKIKNQNLQQAIYDEVRRISAKMDGKKFKKSEDENKPFDEWYESDMEWAYEELESLEYVSSVIDYIANETCGWVNDCDIRVIVLAS